MSKKRLELTKASERYLFEWRVGAGIIAYKSGNSMVSYSEFYLDNNNVMRGVVTGKPIQFDVERDEDGFEESAQAVEKVDAEVETLRQQLTDARAENARLTSAMNKAVSQLSYVTFHSAHAAELILKRALNGEEFAHIGIDGVSATHNPNCETCGGTGGYIISDPYMADGVGERFCNCKNPALMVANVESEAIEKGYYRQIVTEALRIINDLHEYQETNFDSDWLAKANAFMEYGDMELEADASQPQAPALSPEEIDWFAKHYVDHDEFRLMPEEGYVDWLDNKAVRFFTSLTKGTLYELREAYNTPANHAAIAARRKELGLGE